MKFKNMALIGVWDLLNQTAEEVERDGSSSVHDTGVHLVTRVDAVIVKVRGLMDGIHQRWEKRRNETAELAEGTMYETDDTYVQVKITNKNNKKLSNMLIVLRNTLTGFTSTRYPFGIIGYEYIRFIRLLDEFADVLKEVSLDEPTDLPITNLGSFGENK